MGNIKIQLKEACQRYLLLTSIIPVLSDTPSIEVRNILQIKQYSGSNHFIISIIGIDIKFLQNALAITSNVVYSLHKTSTRAYILKKAKEWNSKAEVLAELHFDLPKTYKFHRKQSVDVDVDFIRFSKTLSDEG